MSNDNSYGAYHASQGHRQSHFGGMVLIGMAIGAFMGYFGLRFPRGTWAWLLWTFGLPISLFFAIGLPDWSFKRDDITNEWASTLLLWSGGYVIVMCIIGAYFLAKDWNRQHVVNQAARQQMAVIQQQQAYDAHVQACADKARYDFAVAQATGEAVAAAMMRQRPPEGPTGTPQRPTAPKPGPRSPMGSNSPTLWVPTYMGPSKELQRRETSLDGIWINDHRGVDPDSL